jgi:hypothetical protein
MDFFISSIMVGISTISRECTATSNNSFRFETIGSINYFSVEMDISSEWQFEGERIGGDVIIHNIFRNSLALHEISKEQSEFQKAAFQFFTFTKYPIECVERVEVIEYGPGSEVRQNYERCRESFSDQGLSTVESLVFHGTPSVDNVRNIVTGGFKVGGLDPGVRVAHGSAHGPGVYTAISPSTPQQYARGTNAIILAKGLRGRDIHRHTSDPSANSVCPNSDWIIFKQGCQVLPLYVVYFNHGNSSSSQHRPRLTPALRPSAPSISPPRRWNPPDRVDRERREAEEDMVRRAMEASRETHRCEGSEEEELKLAIAVSLSQQQQAVASPGVEVSSFTVGRGGGQGAEDEELRRALEASLKPPGDADDEDEDVQRLLITSVTDTPGRGGGSAGGGEVFETELQRLEEEELAAAIAMSLSLSLTTDTATATATDTDTTAHCDPVPAAVTGNPDCDSSDGEVAVALEEPRQPIVDDDVQEEVTLNDEPATDTSVAANNTTTQRTLIQLGNWWYGHSSTG